MTTPAALRAIRRSAPSPGPSTRWHWQPACAIVSFVVLLGGASAHVPDVNPSSRDIGATDRSWAFYDELPAGETHTWTFDLAKGAPLFIVIGVPTGARWTPEANLTAPSGAIALVRETDVSLEPFAAYASVDVWSLNIPAPDTGTYQLLISGVGGRYVFGFGLAEGFTLPQWIGVPWESLRIHAWQGLPWWPTAALYVVAAGFVLKEARAGPTDRLLAKLGAAFFAASAADRIMLLVFAAVAGGQASWGVWALAVGLALPALALAWGAWRARRTWALAALAVAGLALWAGLLVGPALLAAASLRRLWERRAA